jgi:hypothetical protein
MKNSLNKDEVLDLLRKTVVTVNFMKSDGTLRDMICTLLPEHIPADQKPKDSGYVWPEDVIRVFDIEKGAWRSFRLDSVNSVTV